MRKQSRLNKLQLNIADERSRIINLHRVIRPASEQRVDSSGTYRTRARLLLRVSVSGRQTGTRA